jgi:hypothetical protein
MKTALNSCQIHFPLNCFFDFKEITKGLALSVLFSSIAGYFLVLAVNILSVVCVDNACRRGYCMVGFKCI